MCLYPKFILNRKYIANKKNNGNVPQIKDDRAKYVPVGCGKCMECLKQKARGWQVRLQEELRNNRTALFVTFSFSDESLIKLENELDTNLTGYNLDNKIATLAVRRFLERYRKKYKASIKHWFVTELGKINTERIHIHGIVFTTPELAIALLRDDEHNGDDVINIGSLNKLLSSANERKTTLASLWSYGNIWLGDYVNERTVNYIVKYIYKQDPKHKYYTPVILCSPGIGSQYLKRYDSVNNKFNGKKTNELYTTRNGIKLPLPTYYRNKIYNDDQREALWLQLLDKQTRYVNGIKIDVSQDEKDYFNVLEQQRIINKKLGYGDDKINWNAKKYEQNLRNLKRLERIKKQQNKENQQNELNSTYSDF